MGLLPYMLLHKSQSERQYTSDQLRARASVVGAGELMQRLIRSITPFPNRCDGGANLRAIGRSMAELAAVTSAEFEERMRFLALGRAGDLIAMFERRLQKTGGKPLYWGSEVNGCIEAMRKGALRENYWIPTDLLEPLGNEEARRYFQSMVRRLGQFLEVWPDARRGALELRQNGIALGSG
jgi:hypothetical protein